MGRLAEGTLSKCCVGHIRGLVLSRVRSVAANPLREKHVTEKLSVMVRVDLDCGRAQVAAEGHVTMENVRGLYAVMKRANSIAAGLCIEIDMTGALVEPDALKQLRDCSRTHHLPVHVDPLQSDYRFSILTPEEAEVHAARLVLAA
jgi:hypothetical protein